MVPAHFMTNLVVSKWARWLSKWLFEFWKLKKENYNDLVDQTFKIPNLIDLKFWRDKFQKLKCMILLVIRLNHQSMQALNIARLPFLDSFKSDGYRWSLLLIWYECKWDEKSTPVAASDSDKYIALTSGRMNAHRWLEMMIMINLRHKNVSIGIPS